ncbi:DUF2075 domain-containing protein [Fructobacillus sp. M2-14]|uniref:DUF2075 domain-containing protein n=1 Tax=Fructobacillus broussonetiae TaxID=2713173 RepID=A0ABS5R2V4_9LACO|nr:DUF2075 domain-containing protein [Fructobacillus broussonetiae]MBS9339001.1 DUF2075 domain-containing protein [Fructobacillus broussonetiae]
MTLKNPIVLETNYRKDGIENLELPNGESDVILKYPTVYIVNDEKKHGFDVYVGETNNIRNRTAQHLQERREDWERLGSSKTAKLTIIGHHHFNKSLTLDIENRMRLYLSAVDSVFRLNNRRGNPQGVYYTSEEADEIFEAVWDELHTENAKLFPSREDVEKSALFKSSPFHQLTDEQLANKEILLDKMFDVMRREIPHQLIMVEGAAGTGKTVLLSSFFFDLLALADSNSGMNSKKIALLVNHNEQLKVYKSIAKKLNIKDAVIEKPNSFFKKYIEKGEVFDAVIVDEGHLLATRNGQAFPKSYGKTHLEAIQKMAKVTVLVYDMKQALTSEQYFPIKKFQDMRAHVEQDGNLLILKNQMRIAAEPQTLDWLNDFVYGHQVNPIPSDETYDLRIFDDPQSMYEEIQRKAKKSNSRLSRMLASYDWEWNLNENRDMVQAGDFKQPWNYHYTKQSSAVSWAENPESIKEVGSTFTIQGFDLHYAGVILGKSVKYRDGKVIFDPDASFSKKGKQKPNKADAPEEEKEQAPIKNLNNELNVLLSRGVNGLYIYAVDEALQQKLMEAYSKRNY